MKVIKAEDTRSLEPFRDRIIEGDCLEVMKDIPVRIRCNESMCRRT